MDAPTNRNIPWTVRAAGISDRGQRQENEDRYLVALEQNLFIVSDGMGGRQAGEIAAQVVVTVLPVLLEQMAGTGGTAPEDILRAAIAELSQRLRAESFGRIGLHGLGATVAVAWLRDEWAYLAHLGDSRIYLWRKNHLRPLTQDHSLLALLLRHGEITPDEARTHPARGQISRYVGMEGNFLPDVQAVPLLARDRLLLCSDGLTTVLSDLHIARILRMSPQAEAASQALVRAANEAGGNDNITALVIDCPPEEQIHDPPAKNEQDATG